MKKMKKYIAAVTAAAMAIGLGSCGLIDLDVQSSSSDSAVPAAETNADKDKNTSKETDSEPEPEEVKNYSWALEPTIEAENIFCPNNTFHAADSLGGYENSIIMRDGKYSVIDRSGELLCEDFADVFTMYESADEDFGLALYTKDYREVCSVNKTSSTSGTFEYYYDVDKLQVAVNTDGGLPADLDSAVLQDGQTAAVRLYSETMDMSRQYAIYADGATDESVIYDNCAQPKGGMPEESYVICVEKDGKWGYINSAGKMILDCEYDANYYPTGTAYAYWQSEPQDEIPQFDEPIPYLDSEGYIAVEKDGAAGYFDLNGNAVVELGEFEAARPVYGGTAWVKQNGKWGVIKLEPISTEITVPQTSEPTESADITESGADINDSNTTPTSEPDSSLSSAQSFETTVSNNSQTLEYAKIIDQCKEVCDTDPDNYNEFSRYYVVDINGDGVMELITDLGSCEADRLANIYTYDGEKAVDLGSFVSWRSFFGAGDGVLYSEATAMGSYTLSTITIQGGEIHVERSDATGESKLKNPLTAYMFDDLSGLENV